jgi:hypothetical protein
MKLNKNNILKQIKKAKTIGDMNECFFVILSLSLKEIKSILEEKELPIFAEIMCKFLYYEDTSNRNKINFISNYIRENKTKEDPMTTTTLQLEFINSKLKLNDARYDFIKKQTEILNEKDTDNIDNKLNICYYADKTI